MRYALFAALLATLIASGVGAQQPSPRDGHECGYHAWTDALILFSGSDGTNRINDTWSWDGVSWARLAPLTSPPARVTFGMCQADPAGNLIIFGGYDANSVGLNDTWIWDGTNWIQQTPANSPSARWGHAMAYDKARNRVVLYGGWDTNAIANLDDTWEWDGVNWTEIKPATVPAKRRGCKMVYSVTRQRCVMFGGWDGASDTDETWEWDGLDWVLDGGPRPPQRRYCTLAYDPGRSVVVMHGGEYGPWPATRRNDTWHRGPFGWRITSPVNTPPLRRGHASAFDAGRGVTFVHGGWEDGPNLLGDYWVWNGLDWAEKSPRVLNVPGTFASIQAAINAANDNDVIVVGPGTYGKINYTGKALTIRSQDGAHRTTIDAQGTGHTVLINNTKLTGILEGFTVTGGSAGLGGGVKVEGSGAELRGNVITNNAAANGGAALGGGVYATANLTMICNHVTGNSSSGDGGGLYFGGNPVEMRENVVASNTASGIGGGLRAIGATVRIVNDTFDLNRDRNGVNSVRATSGPITIVNSILRGGVGGSLPGGSSVNFSNIRGGFAGTGNFDADPKFVNAGVGDFHITHASPCRDTGDGTVTGLSALDCEGDPRINGVSVDIGADEFADHLYWTGTASPGRSIQINFVAEPGTNVLWGFSLNPNPLNPPLSIPGYGLLRLNAPIALIPLGPTASNGILAFTLRYPIGFPVPSRFPMQALFSGARLSNLSVVYVE